MSGRDKSSRSRRKSSWTIIIMCKSKISKTIEEGPKTWTIWLLNASLMAVTSRSRNVLSLDSTSNVICRWGSTNAIIQIAEKVLRCHSISHIIWPHIKKIRIRNTFANFRVAAQCSDRNGFWETMSEHTKTSTSSIVNFLAATRNTTPDRTLKCTFESIWALGLSYATIVENNTYPNGTWRSTKSVAAPRNSKTCPTTPSSWARASSTKMTLRLLNKTMEKSKTATSRSVQKGKHLA